MAPTTYRLAVVLATLVISFAAGLVSAQTTLNCALYAKTSLAVACQSYLQSPTLLTPSASCCLELNSVQNLWGSPCYCDVLLTVAAGLIDMKKACALPKDCGVVADMSKCSCSGTSPPASAIPPPGIPTPPSAGSLTPPAGLLTPPAAGSLTPPPGLTATPPGSASPTVPTSGTPSTAATSSSGRSSLAVPIGASVGGMSLAVFIIWLIMSRCRIHVKWDMNAPCWCCYRSPKPQASGKPANSGKTDHYGDKVPTDAHGARF